MTFINKYRHFLYAFLLILPTFYGMRAEYYLLFVAAVFFFERQRIGESVSSFKEAPFSGKNRIVWVVVLIMVMSGINKVVNGNEIWCLKDYYAAFYLFPLLILSSRFSFDERFFRFLIVITAVEAFVGMMEYTVGVRSFLFDQGDNLISDYSLLYNSRVLGLSGNSSIFAYKILLGFILIDFVKLKQWEHWLLRIILLAALLISFSRSATAVLLVYWSIGLILGIIKNRKSIFINPRVQFYGAVVILSIAFQSTLKNQFLRGDHEAESAFGQKELAMAEPGSCAEQHAMPMLPGELDPAKQGWGDKLMMSTENIQSSGRKLIWLNYINFIQDHLLFGNGSDKLMMRQWVKKTQRYKLMHAHNSLLMMISTNGIVISILYLIFYLLFFKSRNYLAIGALVLYSMGNFGLFWGFSYMDVVFLILLTYNIRLSYDNA